MQTSYFAHKQAASDPRAVSIARWPPRWWGARPRYPALAPSADLLRQAKAGLPWSVYCAEYRRAVLAKLDPARVYADLANAILLCWEVPGAPCHRRLVADWLAEALEVEVPELPPVGATRGERSSPATGGLFPP